MKEILSFLYKCSALKKIYNHLNRSLFQLECLFYDLENVFRGFRGHGCRSSDRVFVCSLKFYKNREWQVVSQADLWHEYVEKSGTLVCGSFLSYWLFGRNKGIVVSLEPRYNAPTIKFSSKHKKVFLFVSDSHSKSWLSEYIRKCNVTDILTPYRKTLLYTGFSKPLASRHIHSFPWCVSDRLFENIAIQPKDNRVLGFGQTGGEVYELRTWAFNSGLLTSFDYAGSGNKKYSGDAYFEWLRKFDACVVAMSTSDLYNYTVAKYFEIPSQGLLLIAFKTVDLEEFGFEDGVNYISVNKHNFHQRISSFKENPDSFLDIRRRGYALVKSKHTVRARLEYLDQLIED